MAKKKTGGNTRKTNQPAARVLTQAEKEALAEQLAREQRLLESARFAKEQENKVAAKLEAKKKATLDKSAPKKQSRSKPAGGKIVDPTSNIPNQVAQQPLTNTKPTNVGKVKGPKTTKAPPATGAGVSSSGTSQAPKPKQAPKPNRLPNVTPTGKVTATGKPILRPVPPPPSPIFGGSLPVTANKPVITYGGVNAPNITVRVDVPYTMGEFSKREGMRVTNPPTVPNRTPASAMEFAPSQAKLARDQEQLLRIKRMKEAASKAGSRGKLVAAGLGAAVAGITAYNKFKDWRNEREAEMEAEKAKKSEYRKRR
jgi:hypothetical protein